MTLVIESETVLTASPDAIGSDVDGEIVLISVTTGKYFGFDTIGSEIWRRLQAPISLGDLCAGLQADCDGDAVTIEREAREFVAKLAERGLVTSVG